MFENVKKFMVRKPLRVIEWFDLGGDTRDASRSESGLLIGNAGPRRDKRCICIKAAEIK